MKRFHLLFAAVILLLVPSVMWANTLTPIGTGAFGATSSLINFTGVPIQDVNGLTVGGVAFQYLLGNSPFPGQVFISNGGGPGNTNNVDGTFVLSSGSAAGTLRLVFSQPIFQVGYGFAVLRQGPQLPATSMELFSGGTEVGMVGFTGLSDPTFTGGFAGLNSFLPFDSVNITFGGNPAFVFDNLRFTPVPAPAVPEPASLIMLGSGMAGIASALRRRMKK